TSTILGCSKHNISSLLATRAAPLGCGSAVPPNAGGVSSTDLRAAAGFRRVSVRAGRGRRRHPDVAVTTQEGKPMTVKIAVFRRACLLVRYNLDRQFAGARSRLEPLRTGVTVRRTSVLTGVALLLMASLWMLLSDQRRGELAELRAELAETREALRTARQT